ncbi:hypothetical protein CTI12_AA055830 [Artemisia annua]|uniref:RRM domain-containing protein n=1 Tax=Artemisia annua TaxID=35608 RepID=A0A2U1Q9R2_ARTAN|nr:hypothetical protein CTI12_AA055830 [Artemisia annua]
MVMRSKEDDVLKISTSIFVTNFPENARAKDLWNACKQYGYVVDAFIPVKRNKAGKRFGFVRFIKFFDVERLVSNLCTVWMGNHHLQANVARFHRSAGSSKGIHFNRGGESSVKSPVDNNNNGKRVDTNSYAYVVKGNTSEKDHSDSNPVLVLDDTCINKQEYSLGLAGKVKEFSVLSNLKVVLGSEGFKDIELRYLGGLWVMIGFNSEDTKAKFLSCVGAVSWFSQINQASTDFVLDERIMWVDIEGVPLKIWSDNTFKKIAAKWGSMIYMENADTGFLHSKRLCILTSVTLNIFESFKIIYKGKGFWVRAKEVTGWVPDFDDQCEENSDSEDSVDDQSVGVIKEKFDDSELEMQGENDVSIVPDTMLEKEDVQNVADEGICDSNDKNSYDPFDLYPLLNRKKDTETTNNTDSLKFPPGFTPSEDIEDGQIRDEMRKDESNVLGGEIHVSGIPNSGPKKGDASDDDSGLGYYLRMKVDMTTIVVEDAFAIVLYIWESPTSMYGVRLRDVGVME